MGWGVGVGGGVLPSRLSKGWRGQGLDFPYLSLAFEKEGMR